MSAFPDHLLLRASRVPIRLWVLDRGERVGSASLLDNAARARRWHGGRVGLADCAGLTTGTHWGVLVVAPWDRPAVLRHELGHALSTLLSRRQKPRIEMAFRAARAEQRLLVPLAGKSVGEYVACGLASFAQPQARSALRKQDGRLHAVLSELWDGSAEQEPGALLARCARWLRRVPTPGRGHELDAARSF